MAEVPVLDAAANQPAAGKSKKWLIIGIAAFLVLGAGGAAAFFMMGSGGDHAKKAEKAKEPLAPPTYVALDPPFVVNFEAEQQVRFLQITVQVMTRDPATVELMKANDPMVRNDLLLLYGNQKYDVLSSRAGKEKLRGDTLTAVRKVLETAGGKPATIENVYFTSFVMQ